MFSFRDSVDLWLRIGFGALILLGCYFVMQPFLTAILLAGILAVVSWPLYERALTSFGNRSTIAATFMVCVVIVTVLIPLSIITGVLAHQIPQLIHWVRDWVAGGMKLPDWLIAIPYVGESINEAFHLGFDPAALGDFIQKAIDPVTKWVLSASVGIGNGLFQLALVAFIAFFFYRDGNSLARRGRMFLKRVSGDLADEYTGILVNTTRSVVFGVLGTAVGQGVVAAIDARRDEKGVFRVVFHGGRKDTGLDAVKWAKKCQELGAGEILLTSMDTDGCRDGFDLELTKAICSQVTIPVIASGGCGKLEHFSEVFQKTGADAALAASLFHFRELTVEQVKEHLREQDIPVRRN